MTERILAGTLITPRGVIYNKVLARACEDGSAPLVISDFERETAMTSFRPCVAMVNPSRLSPHILEKIERLAADGVGCEALYQFMLSSGLLGDGPEGRLLDIGAQSIIIEM